MKTAYLIGVIDIKETPPRFEGADIFSEMWPTLGVGKWCFVIYEKKGSDFDVALEGLKHEIRTNPEYAWCRQYLTRTKSQVVLGPEITIDKEFLAEVRQKDCKDGRYTGAGDVDKHREEVCWGCPYYEHGICDEKVKKYAVKDLDAVLAGDVE